MQIPWANPWIGGGEKKQINSVLDSGWVSMGPKTKLFEEKLRSFIGVRHAIAVSNGTVALDLALKALGIGPGDEVIVPAMTYVATVSAVLYQHAIPVFADIETDTFNIDPGAVKKLITKKTRCILYIDYAGMPADHEKLRKISLSTGVPLLQDGAQSFGGRSNGEKLCKQGLISTTSFGFAKLLTLVEGGMIFTDDDALAADMKIRRNQGEAPGKKYIHELLGTNARITDLQAAIGLEQTRKIDAVLRKREYIAKFYYKTFAGNSAVRLPVVRKENRPAWFFAPILIENRDRVTQELNDAGIATRIAYPMPVYEQPFFRIYKQKGRRYDCRNAQWVCQRILNLPMFHAITDKQLSYIVEHTLKSLKRQR